MAKIDGDDRELTERDAAIAKGMLARGDAQHHIAAYFGADSRAISHIKTRKAFADVSKAAPIELPPPGPYRPDPTYVSFYREMVRVNELWEARQMKLAKACLESALKSPAISEERTLVDEVSDDFFRDDYGIMETFE